MTLHGDLGTLELADLLQSLEMHGKTGLLDLEVEERSAHLYFKDGKLALLAREGRADLMDVLVASSKITADDLESAKKRRRRSRKSLGETLAAMECISLEDLAAIANARLLGDACEIFATDTGAFTFTPGSVPRGVFDPEERKLGLGLAISPLLLEAARRSDHWALIRTRVPSDSAHYLVQPRAKFDRVQGDVALAQALCERLDGTRSVDEAVASFPHRRFESYLALAELVETRTIRLVEADDLARLARHLATREPDRAWQIVSRGLAIHQRNRTLLTVQAALAEELGETETAIEALKLLVHIENEAGDHEAARASVARAKLLDPEDASLWEKSLALAIEEGRRDDAAEDGRHLAELYRGPGLHRKACRLFESLLDLEPDAWEWRRELARSRADAGDVAAAVAGLDEAARGHLAAERWERAQEILAEAVSIDPSNEDLEKRLADLESGAFERRRVRRRRLARRGFAGVAAVVAVAWLVYEGVARSAYGDALDRIGREEWIESRRYTEAAALLEEVEESFPLTTTGMFDVPRRKAELLRKAEGRGD